MIQRFACLVTSCVFAPAVSSAGSRQTRIGCKVPKWTKPWGSPRSWNPSARSSRLYTQPSATTSGSPHHVFKGQGAGGPPYNFYTYIKLLLVQLCLGIWSFFLKSSLMHVWKLAKGIYASLYCTIESWNWFGKIKWTATLFFSEDSTTWVAHWLLPLSGGRWL